MIPALLAALAACAAPAPERRFRDTAAALRSIVFVDAARLEGEWVQAAAFASPGAPSCRGGGTIGPGLAADLVLCRDGRQERVRERLVPAGPGRFRAGDEEWWVVWVDEGYRTLAIGTPSGAYGFVLDRGRMPEDRFRAAAAILDFSGYDTARLRRLE